MSNDEENVDVDDDVVVDDDDGGKKASLGSQGEYYLALGHEVGRTLRHSDAHAEEGEVATREYRSQRLQMCIVNYLVENSASKSRSGKIKSPG